MESLLVFAKSPVMGRVKTRLASERNHNEATRLAAAFLDDTATLCASWKKEAVGTDPNRRLVFMVAPDATDPLMLAAARRAGARVVEQADGDLGDRLRDGFEMEFRRGARSVCAIGADSPTVPRHLIDHAFRALAWKRVVLGPTFDGGYWIVGAQRPAPDIFSDIPWSTAAVLPKTLASLRRQNVEPHLLPFWYDIDAAADLEKLVWHARAMRQDEPDAFSSTWRALTAIGLVRGDAT